MNLIGKLNDYRLDNQYFIFMIQNPKFFNLGFFISVSKVLSNSYSDA